MLLKQTELKCIIGPHGPHAVRSCGPFLHMSHVGRSACLVSTLWAHNWGSCAKTTEPIEMPFGQQTR